MLNLKSPKIIVHNLTFKGIEIVPGVLDFDQRGIVYAGPNDIVVTKNEPDDEFLKYLENLGWNFKSTIFLSPSVTSYYSYNSVFHDKKVASFLKKLKGYYLDVYNTSFEEKGFAERVGVPIYANCEVSQRYGTKSGFRKLARKLNFKIPDGVENIRTVDKAIQEIERFFIENKKELAIKIDEGISGAGTTKIKKEDWENKSGQDKRRLVKEAMFKIKQASKDSGVVIEEWLQNVIASPSVQVEVFPNRSFKIVSMHDQLLEGEEKWYVGCIYPAKSLSPKQKKLLIEETRILTKYFIKKNLIGFFGLDVVFTNNGEIYWTEANMRKPGTFYPRIIAEKLNGGSLKGIYYTAADFTVPKFKGTKFKEVKEFLKRWLYPVENEKRGVVLYNVGALKDAGRFDIVSIGKSPKEAHEFYLKVKRKIKEIK